jgi:hypothetical protein
MRRAARYSQLEMNHLIVSAIIARESDKATSEGSDKWSRFTGTRGSYRMHAICGQPRVAYGQRGLRFWLPQPERASPC